MKLFEIVALDRIIHLHRKAPGENSGGKEIGFNAVIMRSYA